MGFSADFDFHVGLSKPFQTKIERLWLLGWRCSNTDKKYVNFCQLVTSFPGYNRVTRSLPWRPDLLEHQRPWTTCSQNSLWWKWCPAAGEEWVCEWWQFPHPTLPLQPFGSYWERDGTGQLITGSIWISLAAEFFSEFLLFLKLAATTDLLQKAGQLCISLCLVPSSRSRRHAGFGVSSEQTFGRHLEWFVTLTAEGSGWHPHVWCIYLWYILADTWGTQIQSPEIRAPVGAQRSLTSQNRSLSWDQVASGRSETGDEGTAVFHQLWRDHSDVLANVYRNAIRLDASDPCHSKSLRPLSLPAVRFSFFAFGIIWQHNWGHRFCSAATFAKNWGLRIESSSVVQPAPQVQLDTQKSTHPTRICLAATEDEVLQYKHIGRRCGG